MLFGNTQVNPASRFIEEIDPKYLDTEKKTTNLLNNIKKVVKENMFNNDEVDFEVGELINHTEYGNGVIVSVDKSIITVAFPHPYGIKKLMKKHKSISKVTVNN